MTHERRAVIDVGTNSVKLLVADVAGGEVQSIFEAGVQTRLGEGLFATRRLQPAAIARTAAAVAEYVAAAGQHGANHVRVFATSAAREAANAADLISAVQQSAGMPLEIISGEQEAEWAFHGARTNPRLAREPLLLLEVGGGSMQCVLGQGDQIHVRASFPVGAVRMLERFPHGDPPRAEARLACHAWLRDCLEREFRPVLAPALQREVALHARHHAVQLVGAGGTATVLARMEQRMEDYDRERIEAVRFSRARLGEWVERLWSLPLAERRTLPGLPPERADVILTGALIYHAVMETLDFGELRVSTRGLRFAAARRTG